MSMPLLPAPTTRTRRPRKLVQIGQLGRVQKRSREAGPGRPCRQLRLGVPARRDDDMTGAPRAFGRRHGPAVAPRQRSIRSASTPTRTSSLRACA